MTWKVGHLFTCLMSKQNLFEDKRLQHFGVVGVVP